MVVKVSSKNQVTIPKEIAEAFTLQKGDVLDVKIVNNKIVMTPKEMILEDKYPRADLEAAEKALSQDWPEEEIVFESGDELLKDLRKRAKK
jgi:AbrB family looped-hinge helix DNA binding protein